jgi:hypothetical protein
MAHTTHLEFVEPVEVCEIKAGTFYWTDPQGEQVEAEFYVKTCDESDNAKQVDDYNEQYTDEFTKLIQDGCTNIRFVEVTPSPFF